MARSVWKGPFVDGYLLKKADTSRASGRNEIIKIWSRRSTILPQFVGLRRSACITGTNSCPCRSARTWSATSSASSRRRGPSPATRRTRKRSGAEMSKPQHPRMLAETEAQADRQQSSREPAQAEPRRRHDPEQAGGSGDREPDLQQAPHRAGGPQGRRERGRECREQPPARCRPAGRDPRRSGQVDRDAPLPCARPRQGGPHRKVVQPPEGCGGRACAGDLPPKPRRRPEIWVTRSIRSGFGSASTAPGTAAGSPDDDYSTAAARRLQAAHASAKEAFGCGRVARGDRAPGEEAARDDLRRAPRRGDRQEGSGHRGPAPRSHEDGEGRGGAEHRRDPQAGDRRAAGWPRTSPSSSSAAWRSAAR